ncbi:MBL fold metallo-hydrolase [Shewanella sp. 1CM18E]|uniref:MBL fold metallo-hydrolase n=1 Tax=Shewanella sp. 1CM18E TaxID=2929169 RepID=UPI0020BD7C51|nr:MBL fold metallo-hydrolase [Shewanella sp. 1CM18E]MCK8046661.1 MBL fold metallo-hydrolase [Shewanella sp. 1CM18E]
MARYLFNVLVFTGLMFVSCFNAQAESTVSVDVFKGETATVNSYLFSNGKSLIVMDVQRSSIEAEKLAKVIQAKGLPLTHILISHGHPDHYIGMNLLMQTFPDVKVVVANEDIKKDIIGFSTWMESVGWLENEPALKPKSAKNPDGFDYENNITLITGDSLAFKGGGELKLDTHYLPAEANHVTTIYIDDLNALFTSDLGYNKVHLWMGQGVTNEHIQNWKAQLLAFNKTYNDSDLVIYPGHGDATSNQLFTEMIGYIEYFQLITESTDSRAEAMAAMKQRYPNYKEADFLLKYSVDFHVKE